MLERPRPLAALPPLCLTAVRERLPCPWSAKINKSRYNCITWKKKINFITTLKPGENILIAWGEGCSNCPQWLSGLKYPFYYIFLIFFFFHVHTFSFKNLPGIQSIYSWSAASPCCGRQLCTTPGCWPPDLVFPYRGMGPDLNSCLTYGFSWDCDLANVCSVTVLMAASTKHVKHFSVPQIIALHWARPQVLGNVPQCQPPTNDQ